MGGYFLCCQRLKGKVEAAGDDGGEERGDFIGSQNDEVFWRRFFKDFEHSIRRFDLHILGVVYYGYPVTTFQGLET
jgi:hypothetical protein